MQLFREERAHLLLGTQRGSQLTAVVELSLVVQSIDIDEEFVGIHHTNREADRNYQTHLDGEVVGHGHSACGQQLDGSLDREERETDDEEDPDRVVLCGTHQLQGIDGCYGLKGDGDDEQYLNQHFRKGLNLTNILFFWEFRQNTTTFAQSQPRNAMKEDKRLKRKVRNSYIVSTISMALVLFLLGSVGYLMLAAMQVADTLQNSIVVMVELKRGTPTEQADSLGRCLQEEGLVSAVQFVSKEQKVEDEEFRRVFASSFEEVLGENPLLDSFDVTLTAASENQAAVDRYVARVEQMAEVDCVSFPAQMADRLHRTVGKIRLVLILFGGALLLISLVLLNNTIRLAIFSKRYVINTMKLVGATKWFIMRPFLWSAIRQGIASGVLAAVLFAVAVYGLGEAVPELSTLADLERVAVLLGVLIGSGVLLSLLFTGFAINKFVNMKSNKIYLY